MCNTFLSEYQSAREFTVWNQFSIMITSEISLTKKPHVLLLIEHRHLHQGRSPEMSFRSQDARDLTLRKIAMKMIFT